MGINQPEYTLEPTDFANTAGCSWSEQSPLEADKGQKVSWELGKCHLGMKIRRNQILKPRAPNKLEWA